VSRWERESKLGSEVDGPRSPAWKNRRQCFPRIGLGDEPSISPFDRNSPPTRRATGRERIGTDLVNVVTGWLTPHNLPGALDGVGVVNHVTAADSEHG
jgi:hypothetical protein